MAPNLWDLARTGVALFIFCLIGQAVRHVYYKILWWNRDRIMRKAGY
jgi:hypothetical protein